MTAPAAATLTKLDEVRVAGHDYALCFARLCTSLLAIHRDTSFPHSFLSDIVRRLFNWLFGRHAASLWNAPFVEKRDDLTSASSALAHDERSRELRARDEQIDQALSAIRALAAVLARQAAKEDDAMERKADGSPSVPRASPDISADPGSS